MSNQLNIKLNTLDYFQDKKSIIPSYIEAYKKIPNGVLDDNFVKKILDNGVESRLSEISVTHFISTLGFTNLSGKSNGPDLIIETKAGNCNIEIVTPIKTESTKEQYEHFNCIQGTRDIKIIDIVDDMSLKTRVSSVYQAKLEQYNKWAAKEVISPKDVNLILINLGYIEGLVTNSLELLWSVFFDRDEVLVEYNNENNVSVSVNKYPAKVKKKGGTEFPQSYFDHPTEETKLISSVLLLNLKYPVTFQADYQGIRFDNPNAKNPLTEELCNLMNYFPKKENPDNYSSEKIKEYMTRKYKS
ncbi:MAG: hypothetical protein COA61_000065 [Zetaproteobacteria bacterium]|nr:hypothetical protein [Zetaproteobacteria bacterium]